MIQVPGARRPRVCPLILLGFSILCVPRVTGAEEVSLPAMRDNTLYAGNPSGSNGAGDHLFAGMNNNGFPGRALIAFDVSGNIPPGSTIHSVTLRLYMSRTVGGSEAVALHTLLADWGEGWSDAVGQEGGGAPPTPGGATWIERFHPHENWSVPGGDFGPVARASTTVDGLGSYSWTSGGMATDVQAWLDDPSTNFGWIVRGDESGGATAKRFDSRSNPATSQRPELTIDFTPPGVPSGACCLPGDTCVILRPADCTAQSGTYQGDLTTCTTDPCTGVPVTIVIEPSRDNTMFEEGGLSNGDGEYLFSGMNADLIKRRGLLGFDLLGAGIPQGAVISDATLTMYKAFGGSAAANVTLHRGLSDWGEGQSDADGDEGSGAPAENGDATWHHAFHPTVPWASEGGDYELTPSATTYVAFEAFYSWSEPAMVADLQIWADDPGDNFGWVVLGRETFTATTLKRWVSRENANADLRPKLEITYSVPPVTPYFGLPPVPVPTENPITEGKRVLGKILFWEEQLSSDRTVACGTCHRPGDGGVDPRDGLHPGADLEFGTDDDILGSPGVRRADADGNYYPDPIFGDGLQVTARATQNFFGGLWAQRNFWDGRADGVFRDPLTNEVVVPVGGALESQALEPITSDVEMAFESRSWADVTSELGAALPMVLATDIPADMLDAIATSPTYPELFAAAFGDPEITPTRIAFALATYQRTLVADETPWDLFMAGDAGALTASQQAGAAFVQEGPCAACHGGPLFTSDTFRNIGLRPPEEDPGREGVTGLPADRGRFKVPSLRNVGLRNRLMHTGQLEDVADVLRFYSMIGHTHFTENQDENILGGIAMTEQERAEVEDFLIHGLTDPRVENETFPFDRPKLSIETPSVVDPGGAGPTADSNWKLQAEASPNPFREVVEIRFRLPRAEDVEVSVFGAAGQLLVRERLPGTEGANVWRWDGRAAHGLSAPQGVYFVRLRSGDASATGRVIRIG